MSLPEGSNSSVRPARVLLVRPSALGDVARTVPALVTLRRALPDAQIDWLVADGYSDLVRHHPALDGVVPFARKRFGQSLWNPLAAAEALAWGRKIRQSHYDLAVDLQGLLRSGLFTRVTGAPRRLGFANAREGASLAYTEKYALDARVHTVDRMLGLLEKAGFPPAHDMTLYPSEQDMAWAEDYLEKQGGGDQPFACIAPTAQWRCKCWPVERYSRVVRHLLDTRATGRRVVILCAPHEREYLRPMFEHFKGNASVMSPKLSVGQMLAVLSKAKLVVCNDSGPLHMAVGLRRPIVSIFGPTDPAVVGPYRRLDTVVSPGPVDHATQRYFRHHRQDQSLISQVSFDAVCRKIEEQLGMGESLGQLDLDKG
jgi:lipopolysaccharide heptosyltransferase I